MTELPFAHGGPPLRGVLRAQPADFVVEEELGFEPDGNGEHVFVLVEKTGANTAWVSQKLAAAAGVGPMAVGYAGMKDRHAVARQTFSVQLAGRPEPDWQALAIAGVRVLSARRHARKLKRGAHRGNRFGIVLRGVAGDRARADAVLAAIGRRGVPNYFGEQRFGRGGGNVALAEALFAGASLRREQRGIALSAARSEVFNAILSGRVADANWDGAVDGEVWMLDGSHSIFGPEPMTDELARRLAAFDIHPTGALWGAGELRTQDAVRALESRIGHAHAALAEGLAGAGLRQERRSLRLAVRDLASEWVGDDALRVEFSLTSGSFATAVLRELCDWRAPEAEGDETPVLSD